MEERDAKPLGDRPWSDGRRGSRLPWQKPHAKVLPTGGLEWAPEPFAFTVGKTVRYIDFAAGSDANDGASKDKPWKHHPWDPAATGQPQAHRGPTTYVFKLGVVYRGQLAAPADDAGTPDEPIRLTSDPAWGTGEAVLCGSEAVTGWKRGADHKDIPDAEKVWHADLAFAPRCVWMIDGGKATRLKLARTPNWTVSDPDDVKSEWWTWEQPQWWTQQNKTTVNGRKMHLGVDTKHLTKSADHYRDAIVRTEWGIVMGTPFPTKVEAVDTAKKALAFQGVWWGDSAVLITNNRYYLEDKPHYLDEPGEFWFERRGAGGRLYLRLPGDRDPNTVAVEAAQRYCLIEDAASAAAPPRTDVLRPEQRDKLLTAGLRHVEVSGLTFRFTNTWWDLEFPAWMHKEVGNACIRALGSTDGLRVSHCRFEHVAKAVRIEPINAQCRNGSVVVSDNDMAHVDAEAITIAKGQGRLNRAEVMRNRLVEIGLRPRRQAHGHAVEVGFPETAEVAGNILDRCYGAGLFIFGGKGSGQPGDAPLSRILIHHNQVTDSLLNTNDWGGIETWQGGPFYVFCNVSGNPGGYWHWAYGPKKPASARFGHAYYLDGSFKNYVFNNIAWGKSKDPLSRLGNAAAFQEIISFENAFFNNTVYNFVKGTRRQAPHAGRDKFLGNVWSGIGEWLFWHAEPAKSEPEGNAVDAGPQKEQFAYETDAYARNVFHDVSDKFACFEPSGRWHNSLESFRKALAERGALASGVGEMSEKPVLRDPAKHDFRLVPDSPAVDAGVKVFVPWGLYASVGEWHFTRNHKDPAQVTDEHWYMAPYYAARDDYWKTPRYPLKGVNVRADDYIDGPLEDWTQGALRLNGRDQYLVLSQEEIAKPFSLEAGKRAASGSVVPATEKRTVDIAETSFLIEACLRIEPGHTVGALVSKMAERGYALSLDGEGRLSFAVRGEAAASASASTRDRVNDGRWHHVVAECDRAAGCLRVYLDGKMAAEARGERLDGSLANAADFLVGKSAKGALLAGAIDFLRVCRGTLADAKTTIAEFRAWEFDGPQYRDFCGHRPAGKGRDAGAIELVP